MKGTASHLLEFLEGARKRFISDTGTGSEVSHFKVAQYMTELPPREVLQHQIQKSLEIAKARFENMIEEEEE